MAYRDAERPQCPACEAALEPMQVTREVDVNIVTQDASSKFLPPRPPMPLAPWTTWTCSACTGQLLETDHLAALIDQAAGDVRALHKRWVGVEDGPTLPCPRCPAKMSAIALYGVAATRCTAHGVWLGKNVLDAILAAARPVG